jgi:CheY-like chemotaxis protein
MNAAEAQFCLTRSHARPDERLPQLVVLDLEMPGLDAYAALREFKSHEATSAVPVVVLTAQHDPRVIGSCYRSGANSVITKAASLKEYFSQIQELAKYWLQVNVTAASENESMSDADAFRVPQHSEPRHDFSRL